MDFEPGCLTKFVFEKKGKAGWALFLPFFDRKIK